MLDERVQIIKILLRSAIGYGGEFHGGHIRQAQHPNAIDQLWCLKERVTIGDHVHLHPVDVRAQPYGIHLLHLDFMSNGERLANCFRIERLCREEVEINGLPVSEAKREGRAARQ